MISFKSLAEYSKLMKQAFPEPFFLRGIKYFQMVSSGVRNQIFVVGCACCGAGGISLPPMVAFDHHRLRPEWAKGEVAGTF